MIGYWSNLGANLAPFCHPKSSKMFQAVSGSVCGHLGPLLFACEPLLAALEPLLGSLVPLYGAVLPFLAALGGFLVDFGTQMEASWLPKSNPKRCYLQKAIFLKKRHFSPRKNHDFEGSGGRSWEQRSIKNRLKTQVNMRRHLGIDFSSILVDFGRFWKPSWTQVGSPNRPNPRKIDAKMHFILHAIFRSIFAPNFDPPNLKNH